MTPGVIRPVANNSFAKLLGDVRKRFQAISPLNFSITDSLAFKVRGILVFRPQRILLWHALQN